MPTRLEELCVQKGLKMTEQRRVISRVLSESTDHPDVEQVYRRAVEIDPKISIATVYRTVRLFEEANVIERLDFGDGRSRFEENREEHHHHLIDLQSGEVIEFVNEEIERLKERIARDLGYELIGHRLELYGIPTNRPAQAVRRQVTRRRDQGAALPVAAAPALPRPAPWRPWCGPIVNYAGKGSPTGSRSKLPLPSISGTIPLCRPPRPARSWPVGSGTVES